MEIPTGRRSYAKGLATREEILDGALPLVNELGDRATLDVLVRELGLTKGRLTHHFPTKDKLLEALHERFETALDEAGRLPDGPWHLRDVAEAFRRSLTVQEQYAYIAVTQSTAISRGTGMHERTKEIFARRLQSVRPMAEYLVHQGLLVPTVLDQRHFDAWCAGLVMCFVAWPIHHRNVHAHMARSLSRSIALRACMNTFVPYLSTTGRAQYEELFPLI
jgi:AcrR family transcriptional regulator